jgi:hypothetical protein
MGKYIMTADRTSRAACWWFISKKVLNGTSCHAAEGVKGKQGSDALKQDTLVIGEAGKETE